jgi:hypothetical protein
LDIVSGKSEVLGKDGVLGLKEGFLGRFFFVN